MKAFLLTLIVLAAPLARAADALILIPPEAAGTAQLASGYTHGEWILWPAASGDPATRILSLLSGVDWRVPSRDVAFHREAGQPVLSGLDHLRKIGYFGLRDELVPGRTLVVGPPSREALLLGLDGRHPAETAEVSGDWPEVGLAVATATSWDEVAKITANAGGRVLVIEYPPEDGRTWSRFWMQGHGWSSKLPAWEGFGMPGLIPARQVGRLLIQPDTFRWEASEVANWGGADQWLIFIGRLAPLTLAICVFFAAFFAGCTVYLVSRQEASRLAACGMKASLLLPATFLLSGRLMQVGDRDLAAFWLIGVFVGLVSLSTVLDIIVRKLVPGAHFLVGVFAVGLFATVASSPVWSIYSNVLGSGEFPVSPEATGALLGYLVGFAAGCRGAVRLAWMGWAGCLAAFAWGLRGAWWASEVWPLALLPLVALLIALRLFRPWQCVAYGLVPLADQRLFRHGFTWAPENLFSAADQVHAINAARYAEFFSSPVVLTTLFLGAAIALMSEPYLFQELRRTLKRDSRSRSLLQAAGAAGAMSLFQPLLLYPAFMCLVGGVFVILVDTARAF